MIQTPTKLFEAFANNGLIAVYALPIRTPSGVYVFVVGRPNDTIDLTELLALQTICTNALNKIVQFKKRPCDSSVPNILTNNQRRVLIALARGMDRPTIARTHCLSEDTVALIEEQIVGRFGCRQCASRDCPVIDCRRAIARGLRAIVVLTSMPTADTSVRSGVGRYQPLARVWLDNDRAVTSCD